MTTNTTITQVIKKLKNKGVNIQALTPRQIDFLKKVKAKDMMWDNRHQPGEIN